MSNTEAIMIRIVQLEAELAALRREVLFFGAYPWTPQSPQERIGASQGGCTQAAFAGQPTAAQSGLCSPSRSRT